MATSGRQKFFELNPYFSVGDSYLIRAKHYFNPELSYAYLISNTSGITEDIISLNYHFAYAFNPKLLFRYGLTTYWWRISGKGGTKSLKNGNETLPFPMPNGSTISYISTLVGGIETFIIDTQKSLRFDLHLMNIADSKNLSYNYLLTINFYL